MSRMCTNLKLFVLGCLLLAIKSHTGQILPPRNVSLSWTNEFCAKLTWAPPENLGATCEYYLNVFKEEPGSSGQPPIPTLDEEYGVNKKGSILFHENVVTREGGPLNFSIQTQCGENQSESVVINQTYPALVKDLQCFIYSSSLTNCSWFPHKHVLDLQLSHQSISVSARVHCSDLGNLIECSAYDYKDGVKTGCRLQGNHFRNNVYFVFRGRLNDTPVINTFRIYIDHVRPPPIHFTLTPVGDKLLVNWTPPDIGDSWTYNISYTECKEQKFRKVYRNHLTSLDIVPHCQYSISIKADFSNGRSDGWTPWSDPKLFSPPHLYAPIYATIIIPVAFAALAVLALVCFRKHKEKIFPKVPEPRDLLRDILNNNNDLSALGNLYIPAQEEECKITLVIDPQEKCCRDEKPNL